MNQTQGLQILMLVPAEGIRGPLPKHTPVLVSALREAGCTVITVPWGRRAEKETLARKLLERGGILVRVLKILRERQPDIMLVKTAHNWVSLARDVPLALLARRSRCRTVVQFHGSRPDKLLAGGKRAFGAATAALLAKVDAALVLSTDELVQWQQCFPSKRFYVVDNPFVSSAPGVGPAPESSGRCMPGRPIVLFVGRLILEKGVLDLLEAFFLVRKNVDCELVFVGEGPMAARIRERIAQCEFSSDVRLTGYLEGSALSKAYCSASVLALPSYSEGFPTVFSEGMTFGLPIITTRIRGAKDHLKEGIHALFVPAHDPPALAAALERLLKDPDKRARMSEANRAKVKDFAPERVVGRYIQVFEDVLRESRCRR